MPLICRPTTPAHNKKAQQPSPTTGLNPGNTQDNFITTAAAPDWASAESPAPVSRASSSSPLPPSHPFAQLPVIPPCRNSYNPPALPPTITANLTRLSRRTAETGPNQLNPQAPATPRQFQSYSNPGYLKAENHALRAMRPAPLPLSTFSKGKSGSTNAYLKSSRAARPAAAVFRLWRSNRAKVGRAAAARFNRCAGQVRPNPTLAVRGLR